MQLFTKMSSCPLCNQSFDSALSNEFVVHVNGCLDLDEQQRMPKNFYVEDQAKLPELLKKQKERQQAPDCVVCGKAKATANHIKQCGKKYGVPTNQLIDLIGKDQDQVNANLQRIVLKDSNLDPGKVVSDLFTENAPTENELTTAGASSANNNQLQPKSTVDQASGSSPGYSKYFVRPQFIGDQAEHPNGDFTIILDKPNDLSRKSTQTKLKVVRKTKAKTAVNQTLVGELAEDVPLHASKKKRTVKLKRNPLVKANLDDKIIQNFRDPYELEREPPKSWKMASLCFDTSEYVVKGFEEFCKPFDFKEQMNGFEIGLENKK